MGLWAGCHGGWVERCSGGKAAERVHLHTPAGSPTPPSLPRNPRRPRWKDIWPSLADWFGLPVAPPVNMPLVKVGGLAGSGWAGTACGGHDRLVLAWIARTSRVCPPPELPC